MSSEHVTKLTLIFYSGALRYLTRHLPASQNNAEQVWATLEQMKAIVHQK